MCKTTKGRQTANPANLVGIPPNQAGGPAGGTGGTGTAPAPVRFDGVPERVPDLTFVVEPRQAADDFINGAFTYHQNCGLAPTTIRSIEHLISLLSATTARIGRMRLVTHAHPTNMAVAMFEGSTVFHANKEFLRGFAQGDIQGLLAVLFLSQRHFLSWNIFRITSFIRTNNAALLTPFGLNTSGTPSGALQEFLFFAADQAFITGNHVRRNNAALTAGQRTNLLAAFRRMGQTAGSTLTGDLEPLRAMVAGMSLADLGFSSGSFNFQVATGADAIDPFPLVGRAVAALENGFRANLNRVKQRFNESSFIDIRGCRAGQDRDYLVAVQEFFGTTDHFPHVSAPKWFQFFGSCPHVAPANNAAIHTLLTAGAGAAAVRDGFEDWARRSKVDPLHKTFWRDLLNGGAVPFCMLAWRARFPQLPIATPGLTEFVPMTFANAIPRMQEFFNVPAASTPSGAALTTLNTFVVGQLTTWAPDLLAQANASTPAARLTALYNALKAINTALSQSLVPATPPSPLRAADITRYQNALIEFLEAHQLLPVRQFMTAAKQRIDDTAEPGLYYYMLQIGMPVFLFATREQLLPGHRVRVLNNRLVVLNTRADAAYRLWPPLLWAEALPPGNTIGSLHVADADARRFAMMVEQAEGANSAVASCPHPDYMAQIESVP